MFYKFLWGAVDKVKREIVINDYENGGLRMIDIETQTNAIKASWVKRYVEGRDGEWSTIMSHYFCFLWNKPTYPYKF